MVKLPDLEAMAIFAKVVETHGITAAARDLGLSAPTISKALTRLEIRLGSRLFNRTSRRLVLTDAGRTLAGPAAALLADAEAAETTMVAQSATPRGSVRLAAPMSFGVQKVAPILPDFMARYPEVSIDLHLSDALVDVIGDGFDIALRIGELPDSSLLARRLAPVPGMILAAPAYLDRRGRPEHPAQLADHDCFAYAYLRTRDAWHFSNATGEQVTVRPSGSLRVNNGEAMLPAAIAGMGIAALPAFVARAALADGRLEQILPEWHASRASLFLLTPPSGPRPLRVQALADHLAAHLSRGDARRTPDARRAGPVHRPARGSAKDR
ncbi:MAG TPA: LysR family transcriptional regulator [Rhodopila sp.]|nr:LysR family transcriptional regulator [Rhodopila sp.]